MNEELKIVISAEISALQKNILNAKKQVEKFTEDSEKGASKMDEAFKAAGDAIGSSIKAGAVAASAALAAVGAALVGTAAGTEEYRANQAKLSATFQTLGADADAAKNTYNDLYRVLGDDGQATEAAAHLAQLTTNQKDLSEWTTITQGVYATFGDSLPIESMTEAANETAKVGQVTGGLADAINWATATNEQWSAALSSNSDAQNAFNKALKEGETREDAFNAALAACNTEAEREKLIRESLTGVYGDAAANYEKTAADTLAQNEAQAKLTETLAELGKVVAPVITAFTEFATEALAKVVPYIQELGEQYAPLLKDVLNETAEAVSAAFGFFVDNWEIFAGIAGVLAGIAAAIGIYNTVAAIKAAMDAAQTTTIWGLVAAHTAQAAAAIAALAPYLLIVAAIAAVIAIIVLCIKYWDDIVAAIKKAWQAIVDAVKAGVDWVINLVKSIIDWVKENWQGLLLLLVNPFAGAFKLIYDNCEGFREVVDKACAAIKKFFADLWTNIKNIFKGVGAWFKNTFIAAVSGIKNVFSGIAGFFGGVWQKIKDIFSKVGSTIASAITNTVKGAINSVLSGAVKIINGFISAINLAIDIINAIPAVNIKKLSKLNVPQLEHGGVLKKGQIGLLEGKGAEAVVPLEKNTGWLDKIAERLNANTSGAPIVLQVDGKTFAQISVDSINQLTKLTGSLPLQLG